MTNRAGRLLIRVDRAAGGLAADLGLYTVSAIFALITAGTSTLVPHRAWGEIAGWAYAVAALLTAAQWLHYRRFPHAGPNARAALAGSGARAALAGLTWVGVALLPLVVQSVQRAAGRTDRAQEEVLVVERMGERLVHDGTPYLGRDAIAALPVDERLMGYSPYQPGMALFGLPRALAGDVWWTDSRVWFAVTTAVALLVAVILLRRPPAFPAALVRAIQAATVLPVCALTLATGGDDLPVLALCLLTLALIATDRHGWAGLAVGAAAATKLFALPMLAVLVILAVATRNRRLLPGALGLPLIVLVPPFLVDAGAVLENVLRFPLGHGLVTSPAQSPFPGYLIAQSVPAGRVVAAGLLVAVAAFITVRIMRRPPRTAETAALIIGWGLLAAILLMPTTRFGYLLYPAAILAWAPALHRTLSNHTATRAPEEDAGLYRL